MELVVNLLAPLSVEIVHVSASHYAQALPGGLRKRGRNRDAFASGCQALCFIAATPGPPQPQSPTWVAERYFDATNPASTSIAAARLCGIGKHGHFIDALPISGQSLVARPTIWP